MNLAAIPFNLVNRPTGEHAPSKSNHVHSFAMVLEQTAGSIHENVHHHSFDGLNSEMTEAEQVIEQLLRSVDQQEDFISAIQLFPTEETALFSKLNRTEEQWNEASAKLAGVLEESDEPMEIDRVIAFMQQELLATTTEPQLNQLIPTNGLVTTGPSEETERIKRSSKDGYVDHIMDASRIIRAKALALIDHQGNSTNDRQNNIVLTRLLEEFRQVNLEIESIKASEMITSKQDEAGVNGKADETSAEEIWRSLTALYDKRATLSTNHAYQSEAKVRPADVGEWLHELTGSHNVHAVSPISMGPYMTPIEQHVIHVNTDQGKVQANEQLVDQLKQIITQQPIGNPALFKQLSISIRPDQLGEIMIRLVQVDGQMVAKITVQSQVAQQALESQIHQLKHLFAPHQVIIERQEGMSAQSHIDQESQQEDFESDHEEEQPGERKEEESSNDRSFQEHFEQLVNESTGE